MNDWPLCVHCHICPQPTPGMCGVDGFDIRNLDGVGKGDSIVPTNTAIVHIEFFPEAVDL